MADAQVVINQNGPLPITASFQALSDGPALVMLSGSVWTQNADTLIGVDLSVDGGPAIGGANIFANNAATHMAVVPIVIPYIFSLGPPPTHEITLSAGTTGTVSDQNDFFQVTILY